MLSCHEAAVLMSRPWDAPLSWRERLGLKLHLLLCHACRRARVQLAFLRRAAGHVDSDHGPTLPEAARRRIVASLDGHGGGPPQSGK